MSITNPAFFSGKAIFFQGIKTHRFAPSAFCFVLISSIRQSKTSAEVRRAPSVTEAATSLRTWSREQLTFKSRPPTGRHLKISPIRDCTGSHRPADFILICVNRAKTLLRTMLASDVGLCRGLTTSTLRQHPTLPAIMGLGKSIDMAKIGIARASALRVISVSLAHTLPSFYFVRNACRLETSNVE